MTVLQNKFDGFEEIGNVNKRSLPIDAIYTYSQKFSCCIAVKAGWKFGINSDRGHDCFCVDRWEPHKVVFVDNNFKKYNHNKHLEVVKQYKPKYCTVRDAIIESDCRLMDIEYYPLEQILDWAYELQEYSENVIVIPKSVEYVDRIPECFMLGYSVPTSYGGTNFDIRYFTGRHIHLLGGSWKKQLELLQLMGNDVVSFDNNSISIMAQYGKYILPDGSCSRIKDIFPNVNNPYYVCIAISLGNISGKINELFS